MAAQVYFENIRPRIIQHINGANASVKLAVSWLTDKGIFKLLLDKLATGIMVSLVTRNDYLNNHPDALPWNDFIEAGGKLYFSRNGEQLHYKFILTDDATVLCTSYNLTCFANGNNRENVMLLNDAEFVSRFVAEFDHLTATLQPQTHVKQMAIEEVAAEMHGFYQTTIAADAAKQPENLEL